MSISLSNLGHTQETLENAWSLPPASYVGEEIYQAEVDKIFHKEWHPIAREADISEAGDYVARNLFGAPVIVVRDNDGNINALSGVCRHRALRLMDEGTGNVSAFQCAYHKWVYDLKGQLQAAPYMEEAAGFNIQKCTLPKFAIDRWMGWVFVNFDSTATPLSERLSSLTAKLSHYEFESWKTVSELEYPSTYNWKIAVENVMESYHHFAVHPQTLQGTWPAKQTYATDSDGPFSILKHSVHPQGGTLTVFLVYPYFVFAIVEPDMLLTWYDFRIEGPRNFTLRLKSILPPEKAAVPEIVKGTTDAANEIHLEDIDICTAVQEGMESRLAERGRLSHLEKALWQFHQYLTEKLD